MTTVTGLTADRMEEIEAQAIVGANIIGSHLILTRHDGATIDAGDVGSSDYRSRINLALGLMGTTFCFFNNKADQPVDLMYYADGDLDRHTLLYAVGLNNSVEDPDFAPQIVNGEMVVPRSLDATSSAGYPLAIVNERFNSVAIVGGFMPREDEENPPTNLSGFALIVGKNPTVDPLEMILDGSVHVGFYASGIQVGVVHPIGTSAPAGPGLEVLSTVTYSYPTPADGELNKIMGYRFVEPNFLYVTGPSGQVRRFQSDYFAEYWPDDNVAGFIFEIAHNGATMATDPEPRLVGFAMGEPGTYNYLTSESTDFTDLEDLVADNDAAALHKAIAGEYNAMANKAAPVAADILSIEDSAAAFAKKKITIDKIISLASATIVDTAPATLDTLNELANALGDDPNFATTMTNALALKAPLASPTFTGSPLFPDGTTTNPGIAFSNDTNSGFVRSDFAGQILDLVLNTNFRTRWYSAGATTFRGGIEATLADGTGEVQIGPNLGANLGIDPSEIQARAGSGVASQLDLNPLGGKVAVGANLSVVTDPAADDEVGDRLYNDNRYVKQSNSPIRTVRVLAAVNVTIATALNAGDTIDAVTLAAGDRVLLFGQTDATENGIWVAGTTPTRATDWAVGQTIEASTLIVVQEGFSFGNKVYEVVTNNPITVGTTAISISTLLSQLGGQPVDTDLTAIAALASAADKAPYATGSGTWALYDLTAFARTLNDDANAAAARRTLEIPKSNRPKISAGAVQYGVPGREFTGGGTGVFTTGVDVYETFTVDEPITIDLVAFEVSALPGADTTIYYAIYAADDNMQPTGAPLLTDNIAVTVAGGTGVKTEAQSLALTPGQYVKAYNSAAGTPFASRFYLSPSRGVLPAMGGNGLASVYFVARASAAFGNPGTAWTNVTGSTGGEAHRMMLRWT